METQINYALLDRQYAAEKGDLDKIITDHLATGQYILGGAVEDLEERIAAYCGVDYCVTVNSGTDALILGLRALGVGEGDEVITPPNSFIASAAAIVHLGAKPVFADVGEDMNVDPAAIKKAITTKTKAIMPVHLTGRVCKMEEIRAIADEYGLFVVEDAAQSFGSAYSGKKSGSFGDLACFSAHPLKVFNACGDAGFITTNNADICKEVKLLRNHGFVTRTHVKEWGFVSRLDAVQAAILRYRLDKVDDYIKARRKNFEQFKKCLDKKNIKLPIEKEHEYNSYQTFVLQVERREALQQYLKEAGIDTSVHYPTPIHLQEAAQELGYKKGDMPVAEGQSSKILSVPISQYLTPDEVTYIAEKINEFYT